MVLDAMQITIALLSQCPFTHIHVNAHPYTHTLANTSALNVEVLQMLMRILWYKWPNRNAEMYTDAMNIGFREM